MIAALPRNNTRLSHRVMRSAELDTDAPPQRVLLTPWGDVESTNGSFRVDEQAVELTLAAFREHGTDLPIDYEHQTLGGAYASPSGQAPAAGWIKRLEAEPGIGLFAHIEWTDAARRLLADRQYRFLSPVAIIRREDRRLVALHSAALTNKPAIVGMPAIVNRMANAAAGSAAESATVTARIHGGTAPEAEHVASAALSGASSATAPRWAWCAPGEPRASARADVGERRMAQLGATPHMDDPVVPTAFPRFTADDFPGNPDADGLDELDEHETPTDHDGEEPRQDSLAELRNLLDLPADAAPREVLLAARQRLAALGQLAREEQARQRVRAAIQSGKLVEAQRTWAEALVAREESLFDEWLRTAPVVVVTGRMKPPTESATVSARTNAAIRRARAEFRASPLLAGLTGEEAYVADALRQSARAQ